MKRLALTALVVSVGVGVVSAVPVAAQTAAPAASTAPAAPAAIPPTARTMPDPAPFRSQIEAFVKAHTARIASGDRAAITQSRDAIIAEVSAADTTSIYKSLYTEQLATALAPLLASPELRVRLQAAIVAARVAEKVDNEQLSGVAEKLMSDESYVAVAWGLKVAKPILDYQIKLPSGLTTSRLPAAVAATVARNGKHGEVVRDAADAFGVTDNDRLLRMPAAAVAQLAPHVLKILEARAELYKSGAPEDTDADRAFLGLIVNRAFGAMPADQRTRAVQRAMDLLILTSRAAAEADGPAQRALAIQAVRLGRNLVVLAGEIDRVAGGQAKALVEAANYFKAASDTIPPAPADLTAAADKVLTAVQALNDYKTVKAPAPAK